MEKPPAHPPTGLQERRRLRLSGKGAAFGLVVAFLFTGILIPAVLRLPTWIEYEVVLLVWWVIWTAALTTLLYHGKRVADDHRLPPARSWLNWLKSGPTSPDAGKRKSSSAQRNTTSSAWGGGWNATGGSGDGEGCLWILGAILALIVLFFALWFLIEVAIPLVLFLLYLVAHGMLSQVVNDRHHCKGRLAPSLGWGLVWATLYTVPLAGTVWCVHYVLAQGPAVP